MSDQELIDQLRGVVRQVEREAAATELYLKGQIRTLKEQINEDNKKAFQGGRDSALQTIRQDNCTKCPTLPPGYMCIHCERLA